MKKNNNVQRFFGEIRKLSDGTFKVMWVDKKVQINQFKSQWKPANARNFARELSKSKLVIK